MTIPMPRADGFTRSTSVPLYWREDGPADASPLLLLHGGPGAHHDYLYPQLLTLADTHRVITYDQRGGGRSRTDDPTPVTWRTQVEDLAAIVTEFELGAPTIIGYSWGALLAMLYAIEAMRPNATSAPIVMPARLVLISPAPVTRPWRNAFELELADRQRGPIMQGMRAQLAASGLRDTDPVAYRQRSFELSVAGYFADPARTRALTSFRVTGRIQQSIWDSLGDFDLRDDLGALRRAVHLPVLVVHGREDPISLDSAASVAETLDATFVAIPDCGHVPYVEQPETLFEAMARFLPS